MNIPTADFSRISPENIHDFMHRFQTSPPEKMTCRSEQREPERGKHRPGKTERLPEATFSAGGPNYLTL